jgi:hypothetical protein
MNTIISQHAYAIHTFKDTLLIQTKTHKDLLQIQSLGDTYNLFHIKEGAAVEILGKATEQELDDKIVELATIPSIEEDLDVFFESYLDPIDESELDTLADGE